MASGESLEHASLSMAPMITAAKKTAFSNMANTMPTILQESIVFFSGTINTSWYCDTMESNTG